jgi:hypothetical protein
VAHTCNPSYSGGRDQEDHGSKPARANSSQAPLKNRSQKIGLVEWFKVKALISSPRTANNNNENLRNQCFECREMREGLVSPMCLP